MGKNNGKVSPAEVISAAWGAAVLETEIEPAPVLPGDDAAFLIKTLHAMGFGMGYERVRMDRGLSKYGDHYELGYTHGEVGVRLSHRPNFGIRRLEGAADQFKEALLANQSAASGLVS